MFKKLLYPLPFLLLGPWAVGQTTLQTQIVSPSDDAEEYIGTPNNDVFRSHGSIDLGSSDIELGAEKQGGVNPSIAGLRFPGLDIPKGAQILNARIIFTVDKTEKNEDPANYQIFVEDNVSSVTFTEDSADVSSRAWSNDSVAWNLPSGSWDVIGAKESTADISSLVQQIVSKSDWEAGNALTFFITGTGVREAESSEDAPNAPMLEVTYLTATVAESQIVSPSDDAEEYIGTPNNDLFRTHGSMDLESSDIEIGAEKQGGVNPSIAGLRFTTLGIPQGAKILSAYVTFTVDKTEKNEDPADYQIFVEDEVNSLTFTEDSANISMRTWLNDSVAWNVSPTSWANIGDKESTSDISSLVQQLVSKEDWTEGSPLAVFITGTGVREAESSEDLPNAPKLTVKYVPVSKNEIAVTNDSDDSEEIIEGATVTNLGAIDLESSDLEFGSEKVSGEDNQLVGIKFSNIDIPRFGQVQSAYIQFTVDENGKNEDPFDQYIFVEDVVNPESFTSTAFDMSTRTFANDSVYWTAPSWDNVGDATEAQATSDISSLINHIFMKEDWVAGSSLALYFKGTGRRVAESSQDLVGGPKLVINYLKDEIKFVPELKSEIPNQIVKAGWEMSIDVKPFFQDKDSELSFSITDVIGNDLPADIEVNNSVVSGTIDIPTAISVKVWASSDGDTVTDVFEVAFEADNTPILTQLGSINLGAFDEGAAEISTYDPASKKLFVTNAEIGAINVIDLTDPENLVIVDTINLPAFADGVTSVAVKNGLLAAALPDTVNQENGFVYVYDLNGTELWNVEVGALPDMVTFNEDGTKILVANEGEPNDDYTVDPEGTVSIIDVNTEVVTTIDFTAFNGQEAALFATGLRIYGPGATVAQDIEPEYITVSGDTAYVALQENNGLAMIQISTASILSVKGFGFKDYSLEGNGIDLPSTEGILIENWDILGMYQPDAIASFEIAGQKYVITANEGDARDYDGYSEESSISKINLSEDEIDNVDLVREFGAKLKLTTAHPDTNASGEYETIYSFGTRSFSIWNGETGTQVYDSGDELERITSSLFPANFNASNSNFDFKNRSDDKGPEPEAVAVGMVDGVLYAFIGLERIGGIMVYNISDPMNPEFVEYLNNRDFASGTPEAENVGDSGPEGLLFVSADDSPNNTALIIVSNEVSGTVTTYAVGEEEPRFTLGIFHNNDGESDLLGDSITVNGIDTYGGSISQFKFTLDSLRDQADDRGYETIMLSSGDNFLAGLEYNASQANGIYYDAVALDSLDYDAIDLGNHDFDFGTQVLSEFISEITVNQAPYLSSNLSFENVPELKALADVDRIMSSTIIERNGEEIGVIGLTTPLLPIISSPGNTIVSEEIVDSVQTQIDLLEAEGVNKIILISHLQGLDEELTLAESLSGIDVIIAGGGDELLSNDPDKGLPYNIEAPVGSYPLVTKDEDDNDVYVVTTPGNYRYLGNLLIDFNDEGHVTRVYESSDLVLITGPSDEDMVTLIEDPINDYIGDLATNVIAVLEDSVDFRRETLRNQETNGGNLFADALLWQAQETHGTFGVKEPQVAIQNAGGLRLEAILEPGNLTEDKTYETAAFTNIVSVIEDIAPEKFLELIEHGLASAPNLDGRFPQVSGFEIVYDPAGTPLDRVKSITLDDNTVIVENGEVASGAPDITMATIDFTANGGDGYPFSPLTYTTLGATYQQAFLNYLTIGLDSLVTEAQYPFGMNDRIIEEITIAEAVDSVQEDFSTVCPEALDGWVEFHSQDDLSTCSGSDYIQYNGFGVGIGESWLITPRINFDEDDYTFDFTAENDFGRNAGPDAEVFYSTDYVGLGDPRSFTWINIQEATDFLNEDPKPTSKTNSGLIDLSSITSEAHVAIVYYSDATNGGGSSRLNIFDITIKPTEPIVTEGFMTIAEIQGDGEVSPLENSLIRTSGIVTANFDGELFPGAGFDAAIDGFYIQDNVGDGNPATSEGIFVASSEEVEIGDSVVLGGVVLESFGLTQVTTLDSFEIVSSGNPLPTVQTVSLPLTGQSEFESLEGMWVDFVDEMTVTENRNLENFGEVRLSVGGRLYQPTQLIDPNDANATDNTAFGNSNVAAVTALQNQNDAGSFILGDGRTGSNLTPIPFLDTDNSLRAGTKVTSLSGILTYGFGNYSLIPTAAPTFDYVEADVMPDLSNASLKVISFNVLNYFNGDGQGGGFPTSRGAADMDELTRQTQKIVSAMVAMDGDIYALMEIENDEDDGFSAMQALVDSLNATIGSNMYDYVKTGIVKRSNGDFDEIKNGFIYKTSTVDTVGEFAILDNNFDVMYEDGKNRPTIAQTFKELSSGELFTAAVCHLKSKGSDCNSLGDPDDNDGQANCNVTRTLAAGTMAAWLNTDPTNSGDEDFLILGDVNAYAQEDPMDTLRAEGFTNLKPDSAFSYVFDGQYGALDHALANLSLSGQVVESDVWHINSIENDFKAYDGLESEFVADPYWSSDHDPVMVGLNLVTVGVTSTQAANSISAYPNPTDGIVEFSESISGTVYNVLGLEVAQLKDSEMLNMSDFPEGAYMIRTREGALLRVIFSR